MIEFIVKAICGGICFIIMALCWGEANAIGAAASIWMLAMNLNNNDEAKPLAIPCCHEKGCHNEYESWEEPM